jgi:beta-phosphoglucomutase-like phosphatase (HAD superfamily)
VSPPLAVILDFNGTLSDDEPLLDRLFREVLRDVLGIELTSEQYFTDLAGLSDPEIAESAVRAGGVEPTPELCDRVLRAKIDRYKEEVAIQVPVGLDAVAFVRALAAHVPVSIASGAVREEIELVLDLAGIGGLFASIVCIDDVERGKPDPEGYLLGLARLNDGPGAAIAAADTLAIEDSAAGVAAARSAGMRCAAIAGDERAEAAADFTIERLDAEAAARLLTGS